MGKLGGQTWDLFLGTTEEESTRHLRYPLMLIFFPRISIKAFMYINICLFAIFLMCEGYNFIVYTIIYIYMLDQFVYTRSWIALGMLRF